MSRPVQTHCSKCSGHLRGGGVWCFSCGTYMHVRCSGLSNAREHHDAFVCQTCTAERQDAASASQEIATTNSTATSSPGDFWANFTEQKKNLLKSIHAEVVHWKPVFFLITRNKTGFKFVDVMNTVLSGSLGDNDKAEAALAAAMTLPHLILPRTKDGNDGSISKTISRRLDLWINCDFDKLFNEAKALQTRLSNSKRKHNVCEFKEFDKHMTAGKISNAIRCLTDESKGGVLSINEKVPVNGGTKTVLEILHEKHPKSAEMNPDYITKPDQNTLPYHPSIFDRINGPTIRKAALKTHGSHGPSGLDAQEWRRILTSFKKSSEDLCKTLSKLAIRIATEDVCFLDAYNSCRLIALDKCPGVRPIGIGEVLRRIIGRSIMGCVKADLKRLGSNFQLCLGQKCGIEHAIHSLRDQFENKNVEAILLIDAQNAFNSLNRKLALENIKLLCPSIFTALSNSYKTPSRLFINRKTILSEEGTTQGDPLAMAMYGVAILPLIKQVDSHEIVQKWYADDGNSAGSVGALRTQYDKLQQHGPHYGYKVIKCHLVTKKEHMNLAKKTFENLDVDIIEGHRVLGSVIGTEAKSNEFLTEKLNKYTNLLHKLQKHAKKSPQNVYKALTNAVQQKLKFISRTTPNSSRLLVESEKIIHDSLIPSMINHPTYDDKYRQIFSLPVREGGLNISLPEDNEKEYERSRLITSPFNEPSIDSEQNQERLIQLIKVDKEKTMQDKKQKIHDMLSDSDSYAISLAKEKGASCWLNAMPLKRYNFDLTKSEFRDGIALRYGWDPVKLPSFCECGEMFSVSHALHCPKGGFTHIRHNDIRDSFANLLDEVCDNVEIEPCLQPLQGETFANRSTTTDDDARLDIKANGLWESRYSKTYFDVKVFNPYARTCSRNIPDSYRQHESSKKLKYEQRIVDVEKGSFNPLVFSCTGGAGPSATKVMKRIAGKMSDRKDDSYSDIITYIRTKLSFALLRSSVLCLRGSRSLHRRAAVEASIGTVVEEGRLLV